MRKAARRFRFPRLWKLTTVAVIGFSLLALGSVYAMRALPHPGCLIYHDSGRETWEFDLTSGRVFVWEDTNPRSGVLSPDNRHYAYLSPSTQNTELFTFYLQPISANFQMVGDPIPLQEGISLLGLGRPTLTTNRVAWNSDKIALLWLDANQSAHLTTAQLDGTEVRDGIFTSREDWAMPSTIRLHGLSADSAFLSVDEGVVQPLGGVSYSFWSLREMTLVATPLDNAPLMLGAWSRSGHRFAAITGRDDETAELLVFVPGEATATARVKLPQNAYEYLEWSPDDRYLLVVSLAIDAAFVKRWHYDIYTAGGRLLYGNITGDRTIGAGTGMMLTGIWADAAHLLYLKERPVTENHVSDLMLLDVESGLHRLIAANIMIPFSGEMFYVSPFQTILSAGSSGNLLVLPQGNHLLIPRWVGGKVTVELASLNGGQRTVLVEDADLLFSPRVSMSEDSFWSPDGRWVRLLWVYSRDGRQRVRLTVAKSDGSLVRTFDDDVDDITALRSIDLTEPQAWLGFIAERGRQRGIEVFNAETGEHRRFVTGLDRREQTWNLFPNPGGSHVLVTIANFSGQAGSRLYLMPLEGGEQVEVTRQMLGAALWSPDGQHVSYLTQLDGSKFALEMVALNGRSAGQRVVNHRFDGETILRSWTRCEMRVSA